MGKYQHFEDVGLTTIDDEFHVCHLGVYKYLKRHLLERFRGILFDLSSIGADTILVRSAERWLKRVVSAENETKTTVF